MHAVNKMRPIATDGVYVSVCACLYVGRGVRMLVAFVSPAKTAEPIEMPFGVMTHMGARNHALDGGVNIGQIHSQTREVASQRCGHLTTYFRHLL